MMHRNDSNPSYSMTSSRPWLARSLTVTTWLLALAVVMPAWAQVPRAPAPVPATIPATVPPSVPPRVPPAVPTQAGPRPAPQAGKPADPHGKPAAPQNAQQIRDKLRLNIRALRAQKLAEVLKPDSATAIKLQEISEKYGDQVMRLQQDAGTAKRDLVKQLQGANPDPAAVTRLTEQLLALRSQVNRTEEERMMAVRKVLTPVQFGKFLIAWPKINRQIQVKIYQALQKLGEKDADVL